MTFEVDNSKEILLKAASMLRRCADDLERHAEKIISEDNVGDAMAFAANDVSNAFLNLRLDLFVRSAERAAGRLTPHE